MSSALASLDSLPIRPHAPHARVDSAPVSFETLVGPVRPARRQVSSRELNLLATVAHELRNPLTSLRLSLDMLMSDFDELEPESALLLIRRAQRSASWLQSLTENLTSAAAVDAGRLEVHPETVDVRECIEDAVVLVHGLLETRGQSVRFTESTPTATAVADPARVTQVIANLLSNASRYSVEGDEIELHVSPVGQFLWVRVTDHGPGISLEDQQRIFGAWMRAEGAAPGGLGLGLSIVQNLIQRLGGRVGVESTLGQGATFWFTLPLASSDRAEAACPR
jgi:signal transduction histidine kinase